MKLKNVTKKVLMGMMAGAMTLSMTACGGLNGVLATPGVQSSLGNSIDASLDSDFEMYLGQEIDGQIKMVGPSDIKAVKAAGLDGISYHPGFDGSLVLRGLPRGAKQIEIEYANADKVVVMPIQTEQRLNGKLILRGITRMARSEDGRMMIGAHYAGYDFDRDGKFDTERPRFFQQGLVLRIFDPASGETRQYEALNGRIDLSKMPTLTVQGEDKYMPVPPRPPFEKVSDHAVIVDQSQSTEPDPGETFNQAETLSGLRTETETKIER